MSLDGVDGLVWLAQESKRGMSKEKADELMQDFFASRRKERSEEQEMLQESLEGLREGVDSLKRNEYMSGSVLDSVNFLKHDEAAPPPKTRSGTVTKAMLTAITTPDKAELYEKKAEAAAKIIGGLVHGAFATMTGEAGAATAIETVRSITPGRRRPGKEEEEARGVTGRTPRTARSRSVGRDTARGQEGEEARGEDGQERLGRRVQFGEEVKGGGKESLQTLERERQDLMSKIMVCVFCAGGFPLPHFLFPIPNPAL